MKRSSYLHKAIRHDENRPITGDDRRQQSQQVGVLPQDPNLTNSRSKALRPAGARMKKTKMFKKRQVHGSTATATQGSTNSDDMRKINWAPGPDPFT
jgi:hypothetical protein